MMRAPELTLGILGGMGPAATAEFLRLLASRAPAVRDQEHPRLLLLSEPGIPDRISAFLGEGEDPSLKLRQGLESLVSWGADLLAVPCNTAHIFIDSFVRTLPVPLIHIVEATVVQAERQSPDGAWLIATGATRNSGIYEREARRCDYPLYHIAEGAQLRVTEVIGKVKAGRLAEAARVMGGTLQDLWKERDLPVVLACTELPIAYQAAGLPAGMAVSSLEALAKACLMELYKTTTDF